MATITTTLSTYPGEPPGDGLCLIFWDPRYEFYPGGIGSSLGYCNTTQPLMNNAWSDTGTVNGIQGAYLGIGFDVKGNFSTTNDLKPGSRIVGTDNYTISACTSTALSPNSICVRCGELSSYRVVSTTDNLSTYGTSSTTLSSHEKYGNSPPITLHQNVTSRDDIIFKSVKVTLQNEGKHVKVEIKNPVDG